MVDPKGFYHWVLGLDSRGGSAVVGAYFFKVILNIPLLLPFLPLIDSLAHLLLASPRAAEAGMVFEQILCFGHEGNLLHL